MRIDQSNFKFKKGIYNRYQLRDEFFTLAAFDNNNRKKSR